MKYYLKIFLPIIFFVIIDQMLKWLFISYWPELVTKNSNIIFGLISNTLVMCLLLIIGVIILIFFILSAKKILSKNLSLVISLLISGVVSNLIDRIARGYVIDYIHINQLMYFNLADVFILLAIIIYIASINKKPA
jgi:signal peptidase II